MALVALVIGTAVTASATERVTLPLVAAGALGWSFVPVAQLVTGLMLVRGRAGNRIELLERYFATHVPWSLWILLAFAALVVWPASRQFGDWWVLTIAAPGVWTAVLLERFCRDELRLERRAALRRVAIHQAATCALAFAYVFVAVALWPRLLGLVG